VVLPDIGTALDADGTIAFALNMPLGCVAVAGLLLARSVRPHKLRITTLAVIPCTSICTWVVTSLVASRFIDRGRVRYCVAQPERVGAADHAACAAVAVAPSSSW
jgi:hypothetical protein